MKNKEQDGFIMLPYFLVPYKRGGVESFSHLPELVGRLVIAMGNKIYHQIEPTELNEIEKGIYSAWIEGSLEHREKVERRHIIAQKGGIASAESRIKNGQKTAAKLATDKDAVHNNLYFSPVAIALEIINETGNKRSENALKKFLRTKGEDNFRNCVESFYCGLQDGDAKPENLGAALFANLSKYPDVLS